MTGMNVRAAVWVGCYFVITILKMKLIIFIEAFFRTVPVEFATWLLKEREHVVKKNKHRYDIRYNRLYTLFFRDVISFSSNTIIVVEDKYPFLNLRNINAFEKYKANFCFLSFYELMLYSWEHYFFLRDSVALFNYVVKFEWGI